MDKRDSEVQQIGLLVDFITNEYPNFFKRNEYIHPVYGMCKSLTIYQKHVTIDYKNINEILFDYVNNRIIISVEGPQKRVYITNKFIQDRTVI